MTSCRKGIEVCRSQSETPVITESHYPQCFDQNVPVIVWQRQLLFLVSTPPTSVSWIFGIRQIQPENQVTITLIRLRGHLEQIQRDTNSAFLVSKMCLSGFDNGSPPALIREITITACFGSTTSWMMIIVKTQWLQDFRSANVLLLQMSALVDHFRLERETCVQKMSIAGPFGTLCFFRGIRAMRIMRIKTAMKALMCILCRVVTALCMLHYLLHRLET